MCALRTRRRHVSRGVCDYHSHGRPIDLLLSTLPVTIVNLILQYKILVVALRCLQLVEVCTYTPTSGIHAFRVVMCPHHARRVVRVPRPPQLRGASGMETSMQLNRLH